MDNVVLKTESDFSYVQVVNFPKRIKLSEHSSNNVFNKIQRSLPKDESTNKVISFPQTDLKQSNLPSPEKDVDGKVISFPQTDLKQDNQQIGVNQSAEKDVNQNSSYVGTVLENVDLNDCAQYTNQVLTNLDSRLIRLTDVMYIKVVANTANIKAKESIALSEISTPNTEIKTESVKSVVSTDTEVTFDSNQVKNTVENAFDSVSTVETGKEDNNVKKASYSKAKVKKYKLNDRQLPTNMVSGNSLFDSNTLADTRNSNLDFDDKKDREVPIVAPERKDTFLFDDLSMSAPKVSHPIASEKIDFSAGELKNIQVSSEKDEDFEKLLAKVAKRRKDEETSRTKKVDAEKSFESSVQVLKTATQRYDVSNKALEEVKAKAYAYLNEIEANIEDNMKKEHELRVMTEQQIEEARKIEAVADRNEAHIEQFNSVLAVGSDVKSGINDNTKTYSRG